MFMVTPVPVPGVNETAPVDVNDLFVPKVRLLLIVVVPVVAPRDRVVAAPPIARFVTFALNIVPVAVVVVISAEPGLFTANVPCVVRLPETVAYWSTCRNPLA